jgi:EAL domain-containing protein (putative c-di-GMP-specific phosphodiesterase class I)
VETVSGALGRAGLPGRRLQVEITESVLLQDDESVLRTLAALRLQGVRLAIDDFGTGYSSLGYLRRFAVDTIKIDRSFVADLSENPNSLAILRAVMSLGADLGVAITAEGIETPGQLERLRRLGCRDGQGFLFGPPSPMVVTGGSPTF